MIASSLSGAHQFTIQNSQFNTHQTTIVRSPDLDPALLILHKHRALEACHTSKTAANASKCKEGTQVEVIEDMTTWADGVLDDPDSPAESILWLRGPAGAGKTCILRTVADIYGGKRRLAGVYFFSTRVPGLDNEAPFIATFASYLIEAIPALDEPVLQTIRSHPTIFNQSLEYQLDKLISNHLRSIPPESLAPRLLIIDGFDECRDSQERAHLLRIIHSLVTPPHSFRVIMASRPEFDIRTAFNQPPLNSITKILHLESYDTSDEIYQYLVDEFAWIRESHPAKDSIPLEWPGQETLERLTEKSSGIWAYPSTVIKYVDNPRRHPVEQLKHAIDASSNASSGRPFAELDALYEIVLNPPDTDIPLMKRLLHLAIEVTRSGLGSYVLMPSPLSDFLSLTKGTIEITFCDLHSVLSVPDSNQHHIHFHHKSLEDYLSSPERSNKLYQSREDTRADLMTVFCVMGKVPQWSGSAIAYFGPEDESLPVPPEIASASRPGDDQVVPGPSPSASPLTVNESTTPHPNSDPPTIDNPIDSTSNPQLPNPVAPVPDLDEVVASTPPTKTLSWSGLRQVKALEFTGLRPIFLLVIVSALVGLWSVYILKRPT
ncbi:hypothetical protein MD484_g7519, partial [Candolleomyces efflorescens]